MWLICSLSVPEYFKDKPHYHLPLIYTQPIVFDEKEALHEATCAEALIFTSKEGVKYFASCLKKLPKGKTIFCVGPATTQEVNKAYEGTCHIPEIHTQEGLINLINKHTVTTFFYPRAQEIRPLLKIALNKKGRSLKECVCYKTTTLAHATLPKEPITGYFFGSPSNVKAFSDCFNKIDHLPIFVQGPVTGEAVREIFGMTSSDIVDDNPKLSFSSS